MLALSLKLMLALSLEYTLALSLEYNAGAVLLRAADRYAYTGWKHCLFCRD